MVPIFPPRPKPGQVPPELSSSAAKLHMAVPAKDSELEPVSDSSHSLDTPGIFIVFEGGDSCGKSTHAKRLAETLQGLGHTVLLTREPGGTDMGNAIRDALLDPASVLDERTEALLYATDRAHHVDSVVRPALQRGDVVISDRYMDSSIAYQGAGRGMGEDDIEALSLWATYGLQPDLTVIMDVDAAEASARREGDHDRMEAAGLQFHQAVRQSMLARAQKEPQRYVIIDATEPKDDVEAAVWRAVRLRVGDKLNLLDTPEGPQGASS